MGEWDVGGAREMTRVSDAVWATWLKVPDLELEYKGRKSFPCLARAGDVAMFVSDVWHRRMPPTERSTGRFFLQTNYARRDLAQRVLPTSQVNHTTPEARARALTERERLLIGLHPERFYDG